MNIKERIQAMAALGVRMRHEDEALQAVMQQTYYHNKWFTQENVQAAIAAISDEMLVKSKLEDWVQGYGLKDETETRTVALVLAGNIPLVGFHDVLSVFMAGHRSLIKLSEKDKFLLPFFIGELKKIDPRTADYFAFTERLEKFDAVIATGSNNSARYFESYFSKYPHIIRRNRTSIGLLNGRETSEQLQKLGEDIFSYFGLGCRNVSKLMVPENYDFDILLTEMHEFRAIVQHNKYKNNFDYNYTLYILNKMEYKANGCILLLENPSPFSRIACLHYEYYKNENDLTEKLARDREHTQCLVGDMKLAGFEVLPFGKAQHPGLSDYADGVDTLQFLTELAV